MAQPILQKFESDNFKGESVKNFSFIYACALSRPMEAHRRFFILLKKGERRMVDKNFNTRIVLKHDLEANWKLAVNFTPKDGEVIIYDADMDNPVRIKIGNGIDKINDLPFYENGVQV